LSQLEPLTHADGVATISGRVRDDGKPQAAIDDDSPVIVDRPLVADFCLIPSTVNVLNSCTESIAQ